MSLLIKILKWTLGLLLLTLFILSFWFWFTPVGVTNYINKVSYQMILNSPQSLTSLGLIDNTFLDFHSGKLDDYTQEAEVKEQALIIRAREGLDRYGPDGLEGQELITWNIAAWYLDNMISGFEFEHSGYRINQISGVTVNLPSFLTDRHQIVSTTSAERYLSRLQDFGRVLEEVTVRFQDDAEAGVVPPIFIIDKALLGMNQFIAGGASENPLVSTLPAKLESIGMNSADVSSFVSEAESIVSREIIPRYQIIIEIFENLRPISNNEAGIWRIPRGEEIYLNNLISITTTDYSPGDIHQTGLSEVSRINAEMTAILDAQGVEGSSFAERMNNIMSDERFIYSNDAQGKEEMIAQLYDIYDSIMSQADEYFITLPPQELEIRPVPEFAQASAPGGYYNSPALDGSRPGIFYINQNNTADNPSWTLPTLLVHEGAPGHHFQIASSQLIEGVPLLRRLSPFGAYVEGWALYSEYLAQHDMGIYADDPLGDLGRLQAEIFRAVRLVVDTGMHAFRWSREEAIAYMIENTGMTEAEVTREIERYIVWPGQATAYKTGQLAIIDLREEAEARLGDKFDIREFHELILMNGAMPLNLLSQSVNNWIDAQL
jgi:uncharacterized protein (DUF885 family)